VDYQHPDLGPVLFVNPGEDLDGDGQVTAADFNGIDDDNNGFVDDIRGWDFAGASSSSTGDNDIRPPSSGKYNILSHGSHVSGIAAALADNETGIAGIAMGSKIIGTKQTYDNDSNGYLWYAYDGVLYCAKMGARVINCSWGSDYYSEEADSLMKHISEQYGSIIVCAAGNDNNNNDNHHFYPSDYSATLAVAALTSGDARAGFSNYGHVIDISAPGTGIFSTIHLDAGGYATWQGTSMASPVVAGSIALLEAWYPEQSNSEILNMLYREADDLDAVNPAYTGLLGAGRVNVYRPIARTLFPELKPDSVHLEIIDDDGDGQLNAGESARIIVFSSNNAGWQDAEGVISQLASDESAVAITSNRAVLGAMPSGSSTSNISQAFEFSVADSASYQTYSLQIKYSANQLSAHPYNEMYPFTFSLTMFQQGFPVHAVSTNQPLTVAKWERPVILLVSPDNFLHAIDGTGQSLQNFPVDLQGFTNMPPAVADINGDGQEEILICNRNGLLQFINKDGAVIFVKNIEEKVYGNIAAADVDGDGMAEVVFGTMKRRLHVIKSDSSELAGFPLQASSLIDQGVAIGDVAGDNLPEIVFATFDKKLHLVNNSGEELAGWPLELETRCVKNPLLIKTEDGFRIVIVNFIDEIQIIDQDRRFLAEYPLQTHLRKPPALADIDGDGQPEIVCVTEDQKLHVARLDGQTLEPFPLHVKTTSQAAPGFADLDDDGRPEILLGGDDNHLYAFTHQGKQFRNFPVKLAGRLSGGAILTDMDRDGDPEIITAGSSGLYALDLRDTTAASVEWESYLGNNRRTGLYGDKASTAIAMQSPHLAAQFRLYQNWPNPFNPQTTITVSVPLDVQNNIVKLEIFDILGQKVKLLFSGKLNSGVHRFIWRGVDANNHPVSSGVYFYRLSGKNVLLNRRLLLIR